MNILLIDYDGKIPNLALMRISTWHKKQGDTVYLNTCENPDKVYISTLFSWNRSKVKKLLEKYPDAVVGGTGWDLTTTLPPEIESCEPDYSLYTTEDIYCRIKYGIGKKESKIRKAQTISNACIGRSSVGCIRNCQFCVVPKKEGKFRHVAEIGELIDSRQTNRVLILMDNNITADPECLFKLKEIKKRDITVDITQGIDIRLITPEIAAALNDVRHLRSVHYAWDLMNAEKQVLEGIKTLTKYLKTYKQMCFMLIGFNTTFEEDYYRFTKLIELGVDPYVMPYNLQYPSIKHKCFTRWVNSRIYKTCTFNEYKPWKKAQSAEGQLSMFTVA